jgi:hypothetical protein
VGNFPCRRAIPTHASLFNTGLLRLETQKKDDTTIYCAALLLTHKGTFFILPPQKKQGLITQEWRTAVTAIDGFLRERAGLGQRDVT